LERISSNVIEVLFQNVAGRTLNHEKTSVTITGAQPDIGLEHVQSHRLAELCMFRLRGRESTDCNISFAETFPGERSVTLVEVVVK
jgi:hypothetical protein